MVHRRTRDERTASADRSILDVMSPPCPGSPVPPTRQRRHGRPRRSHARRSPSARGIPLPAAWSVAVLVALLLVGTGSAAARVVPGPTASAPVGSGSGAGVGSIGATGSDRSGGPGSPPGRGSSPWPAAGWRPGPTPGGWPLRPEPEVVQGFAPPPVAWAAGHRGVDLLGRPGQRVRSARAGTVSFAGRIAGRGVVVVSHGDTRTTYEPVVASVTPGQAVGRGTVLGRLELLGSHCLPRSCLHWGLVRGETYLDPLTLVGRGPVRLVPWGGLPEVVGVSPGVGG